MGVWRGVVWCVGGRKGGSGGEVGIGVLGLWGVSCLAHSTWSGIAPRSPKWSSYSLDPLAYLGPPMGDGDGGNFP